MKKMNVLVWILSIVFTVNLASCDANERFSSLPASVQKGFHEKYPNARFEEWEMKGIYYVLDFRNAGQSAEAWFDEHAWVMTETDIRKNGLPEAVAQALAASPYSAWRIDDIDFVERALMESIYVIELEKGEQEVELTYLPDGTLLKEEMEHDDEGYLPALPAEILTALGEMYPGSVVLEAELEYNRYEVEILHERKEKEVVFALDFTWQYTSQDVRVAELPQVVLDVINERYAGYRIDDAELFITAAGTSYYELELERGAKEITIRVSSAGELLS